MPDESLRVPAFCPVCGGLMKGKSTNTYYNHGCCIDCFLYFLEGRPAKITEWSKGWRPDYAQVEAMRQFMTL